MDAWMGRYDMRERYEIYMREKGGEEKGRYDGKSKNKARKRPLTVGSISIYMWLDYTDGYM